MALVATTAAGFLNILLEGSGRLLVHHVTDVRLVDAETERARRDHDGPAARLHEQFLLRVPLAGVHLTVVPVRRDAELHQHRVDRVDLTSRRAVDDAGATQALRKARERA